MHAYVSCFLVLPVPTSLDLVAFLHLDYQQSGKHTVKLVGCRTNLSNHYDVSLLGLEAATNVYRGFCDRQAQDMHSA